jgi:hypothetical protein
MLDNCIPLKDFFFVELVRAAVCWVLWLERNNNIIFRSASPSSLKSLGIGISNLAIFFYIQLGILLKFLNLL